MWIGRKGINGFTKRCLFTLLLFACTLLALFSGPSAAVLMLPRWTTIWPGGGATFHLLGNNNTLWPEELSTNTSPILDDYRGSPPRNLGHSNDTCLPSSTAAIAQSLQGQLFENEYYDIDVTDGLVHRKITVVLPGLTGEWETWATTPLLAPCIVSRLLSETWRFQAVFAQETYRVLGKYNNYKWRERGSTTVVIETQIPVVRASCGTRLFQPDEPWNPQVRCLGLMCQDMLELGNS